MKLCSDLRFGARLGYDGPRMSKFSKNLKSAIDNPTIVSTNLAKEVALDHTAGPFTNPPFANLQVSPIGIVPVSYPGAMCCSMACAAFAWATRINLIDFVVRRLAESVSISGAECDFWSGLNKLDFYRFEIPLFIENCMTLMNLSKE